MNVMRFNRINNFYVDGLRAAHRLTLRRYTKPRKQKIMNTSTFKTKSGITAILSIIGAVAGVATKTVDPVTAFQTIATAAMVFFVRDGITTEAAKAAETAAKAARDAVNENIVTPDWT